VKNLYQPDTITEVLDRIGHLHSESEQLWGKMSAAQMLAHCTATLEVATAQKFPPRMIIGFVLGSVFKPAFINNKPFRKNMFTDPSFVIKGKRNFVFERTRLISIIGQFYAGGADKCTTHPHPFFGKLTPQEWATGMYKHLDHHLKQYGV
jgi:hypothetical protein